MELKEEKYSGTYDAEVKQNYDKLKNRPAFKYEAASDPAYRAYKDSYKREGEAAMKNTVAEASDLTGGYGSSYAQRVGQQQYGEYLKKLSDAMPELYESAYKRYTAEGEALKDNFAAASDMADRDYSRYKDQRDRADEQSQFEYKKQQDSFSKLADLVASSGYVPSDEELAAAGMSRQQAYALGFEFMRKNGLLAADMSQLADYYGSGLADAYREGIKLSKN